MDSSPLGNTAPATQIYWKEVTGAGIGALAFTITTFVLVYLTATQVSLSYGTYWGFVSAEVVSFALVSGCLYRLYQKTEEELRARYPTQKVEEVVEDEKGEIPRASLKRGSIPRSSVAKPAEVQLGAKIENIKNLNDEDLDTIEQEKEALFDDAEKYFLAFLEADARSINKKVRKEDIDTIKTAVSNIKKVFLKADSNTVEKQQTLLKEYLFPFLINILIGNLKTMDHALKEEKIADYKKEAAGKWIARQAYLKLNVYPSYKKSIYAMKISAGEREVLLKATKDIVGTTVHQTAEDMTDENNPFRIALTQFFPDFFKEINSPPVDIAWPKFLNFHAKKFGEFADALNKLSFQQ